MEFVFILAIVLIQVFFINVTEIVEIVRALGVYTFVYDEVLPVLLWNKSIPTVRAAEPDRGKTAFFRRESGITDLAKNLSFGTIVFV